MARIESHFTRLANPRHWGFPSFLRLVIGVAFCFAICFGLLLYKWPFTQASVTKALRGQSGLYLRMGAFHATFSPPGYVAENLRFFKDAGEGQPPQLTVRKLVVVARLVDLLLMRKRVAEILIVGLRATVPQSSSQPDERAVNHEPPRFSGIGKIKFEDALIGFPSVEADPHMLTLTIQNFVFNDVSGSRSGSFAGDIAFNEPQGTVRTSGHLGPWNWNDLGRTRVDGFFAIPHADLGTLGGVKGLLNASGRFVGPLNRLVCTGSVTVPEFNISKSSHAVNLSTTFRASVNGLNGDTRLEAAQSHFNQTVVESQGTISNDPHRLGKVASLRLSVQEGKVEDILLLFTRAPQVSMAGTVDLRMNVELPPGPPGFLKKLQLAGDFGIDRSHFTKPKAQTPLNHLSESAAGVSKDVREQSRRTVLSDVAGHISAQHGLATLSNIAFTMPGAQGALSGTYSLVNQAVSLKGSLTTTGELSSTSSGVKAVMLKIITPLLKKHSVTVVPFTITGTAQHPTFTLDLLHKRRS